MASLAFLLLSLSLSHSFVSSLGQDCDPRCLSQTCDSDGVCICSLPDNSTMLDGNRPFLGGEYCDKNRTMCDGTNTFWCQNGACNEIIQGENYTCTCLEGASGEHCEFEGVPCGDSYCYQGAECIQGDILCDCPADWKGSEDCSIPTPKNSANNTSSDPGKEEARDRDKSYFPVTVGVGVVVAALLVFLVAKFLKKRSEGMQFQKLQQVQMRGFIDEDDDPLEHEPLSKAGRT